MPPEVPSNGFISNRKLREMTSVAIRNGLNMAFVSIDMSEADRDNFSVEEEFDILSGAETIGSASLWIEPDFVLENTNNKDLAVVKAVVNASAEIDFSGVYAHINPIADIVNTLGLEAVPVEDRPIDCGSDLYNYAIEREPYELLLKISITTSEIGGLTISIGTGPVVVEEGEQEAFINTVDALVGTITRITENLAGTDNLRYEVIEYDDDDLED